MGYSVYHAPHHVIVTKEFIYYCFTYSPPKLLLFTYLIKESYSFKPRVCFPDLPHCNSPIIYVTSTLSYIYFIYPDLINEVLRISLYDGGSTSIVYNFRLRLYRAPQHVIVTKEFIYVCIL